jgi:PAS domain S-box-containing protein
MSQWVNRRSFVTQLVAGFFVLILLTTLMAGVPAYLLTRLQLEKQAWINVANAHQATQSLLRAEAEELRSLTALFTERPTLQRLARERNLTDFPAYLEEFRQQSGLDLLLFCDAAGEAVAGQTTVSCQTAVRPTYVLIGQRPALVTGQPVIDNLSGADLGTAVAGIWLEAPFWQALAANTGSSYSLYEGDGRFLAGSLPLDSLPDLPPLPTAQALVRPDGTHYYADYLPLTNSAATAVFQLEIALPVNDLIATENQAGLVLIIGAGLVALVAAVMGYWGVRRLVYPLHTLTQAADRISQGELTTPIPAVQDPAELKTLAAALQKSQASMLHALAESSAARDWLNTLIQSIAEGVVTFDGAQRITFFSQGAEALLGWTADNARGRPLEEVLPLADEEPFTLLDALPLTGQKRFLRILTRSGQPALLAITGAMMSPTDGHDTQGALVLRDVTAEESIRLLRSDFLANISHEFRTPLSTLNASMELLLDEEEALTAAEMRQLIKPSHLSLLSLQTLVDNLLESSRIEAGYFAVQKRPFSLNQLLTDALTIVRPLLERRRQTLSLIEPARVFALEGDLARLTQVLVNLLGNASKYSPIGSAIELRVGQQEAVLRLAVLDQGPGIPLAEQVNVFRRFYRLNAQEREQYGIGLGLFVVRTIIAAHNGRVGAENRPEGGAVFWIELPL